MERRLVFLLNSPGRSRSTRRDCGIVVQAELTERKWTQEAKAKCQWWIMILFAYTVLTEI